MTNLFNKELLYRIISVLIFIPIVMIPIIYSNFFSIIIFLFICAIIMCELKDMKLNINQKYIITVTMIATIFSFFSFLFLLIGTIEGKMNIIEIVIIIWLFDTFSYLGGKIIGGKKLMPRISHGKTISGLVVGIFSSLILMELIRNYIIDLSNYSYLFTFIIIFFAFIGDCIASIIKRTALVKDSGTIMPGHGGLFDRFDSFIGVFFVYGIFNFVL